MWTENLILYPPRLCLRTSLSLLFWHLSVSLAFFFHQEAFSTKSVIFSLALLRILYRLLFRSEIFYSLLSSHQKNILNNFGKLIALLLFFLESFICKLQTTNNTSVVVCNSQIISFCFPAVAPPWTNNLRVFDYYDSLRNRLAFRGFN